jgi:tetratricopeptide (TPR) repeat protein
VLTQNGSASRALPLFEAAEAASGELIAGIWRHRCKYMLADALTWMGRYEEAHKLFLDAAVISHSAEPHAVGSSTAMAALNLLRLGHPKQAVTLLEGPDGVPHALGCGVSASPILCLGVLAEARLALGQRDAALEAAARAEAQATEKDDGTGFYSGLFGYSSILNVRLQTKETSGPTGAALDLKRVRKLTKVAPLGRATQSLCQGLWELQHDHPAKAKRLLQDAVRTASDARHPFEHGRALVELAKLCNGAERDQYIQQATAVFERHKMSLELEKLHAQFEP